MLCSLRDSVLKNKNRPAYSDLSTNTWLGMQARTYKILALTCQKACQTFIQYSTTPIEKIEIDKHIVTDPQTHGLACKHIRTKF